MWKLLKHLWRVLTKGRGHGVDELARRLGLGEAELRAVQPTYHEFTIPKRRSGTRRILAPDTPLKKLQRRILRRVLARLRAHPAARGFERGQSIVTNALPHVGQPVIVRMDLRDFFQSTAQVRVYRYLRKIGWNREAAKLLVRLCVHQGGLPQGAPTSPRLSNLVNYRLDARLSAMILRPMFRDPRTGGMIPGRAVGLYTRYADDLTFSFQEDAAATIRHLIRRVQHIARRVGYELHLRRKLQIRRRHACQLVTGLVVNQRVNLPRRTRRWLRAVAHHLATGRPATLTPAQLAGWRALQQMIARETHI